MTPVLISQQKLLELQAQLEQLEESLGRDNLEATKMGGPMDSFKEAASYQVTLGAKRNKVKELQEILANVSILPEKIPGDQVVIGKWFTMDNGINQLRYRLVDPVEADPGHNLISPDAPLGKAVLKQRAGFTFTLNGRNFKLISVE
jgi:transcription elongation GreA/GreB family factor